MPAGEKVERNKTLAQLYFRGNNFGKAIQYANQYLKTAPGSQDMQLLIAQSYYQQKDYKNAIAAAERLTKGGQRPSEDVLQLMLRSSYEIDDKAGTAKALDLLLKYYPSPDTWQRVLDGYIAQTKHDDELLSLYRLAEDVGALTKARQFTDMSQGLVVAGFAIEGQRIIEKGIATGVFQGEEAGRAQRTLDAAKRRADVERAQLPKAAATLAAAKTGPQIFAVGKLYFSAGDYPNASAAISRALAKGGLPDTDGATDALRHRVRPAGQVGAGRQGVYRDQGSEVRRGRAPLDDQGALIPASAIRRGPAGSRGRPEASRQRQRPPAMPGAFSFHRPDERAGGVSRPEASSPWPARRRGLGLDVEHPQSRDRGVLGSLTAPKGARASAGLPRSNEGHAQERVGVVLSVTPPLASPFWIASTAFA